MKSPNSTVFPCSSSTSSSSSIHSTISSSSIVTASSSPYRRCEGLDLLVKAIYHVDGSVIGVPYVQHRILRRRKPALRFLKPQVQDPDHNDGEVILVEEVKKLKNISKSKSKAKAKSLKFQDLGLKPKNCKKRKSMKG